MVSIPEKQLELEKLGTSSGQRQRLEEHSKDQNSGHSSEQRIEGYKQGKAGQCR